ncbi:13592_t:CDS:10, partial [Acaulospora morrowiae]
YWNRDPSSWGSVNDWDIYYINRIPGATKMEAHRSLRFELRILLQELLTTSHEYYNAYNLQKTLLVTTKLQKIKCFLSEVGNVLQSEIFIQMAKCFLPVACEAKCSLPEVGSVLQSGVFIQKAKCFLPVARANCNNNPVNIELWKEHSIKLERLAVENRVNKCEILTVGVRAMTTAVATEFPKEVVKNDLMPQKRITINHTDRSFEREIIADTANNPFLVSEHERDEFADQEAESESQFISVFEDDDDSEDESDDDSDYTPSDDLLDYIVYEDDKDEDTSPKVDKVAFREAHNAIPDTTKLRLSTGKIVEDVLFEFAKDMDCEHHSHSYIVDFDDENVKALFTDVEWKELTKDRIGVSPVPCDIIKELMKYGNKTLEEIRTIVMTTYLKDGEKYNVHKHYDQEWIQMAMRTLCNLYENIDAPLIRNQYEDWFTIALFGTCIDFCIRDIRLGTDIK